MAYLTGTFTGTHAADGKPMQGNVVIVPSVPLVTDATDNIVLSGAITSPLAGGTWSQVLPATDDATLNPTGFRYTIILPNGQRLANVALPAGTTRDYADITAGTSATPAYQAIDVTRAEFQNTVATLATTTEAARLTRPRLVSRNYNLNMIWGGQVGHGYTNTGGTGSTFNLNDTADFALGDRAIKIVTNGTGQNTFVRQLLGPAMDFTNRCPKIWFKVENVTATLQIVLWLGSGGALANAFQWQFGDLNSPPFYSDGEWVALTLPWSTINVTSGTPTRNALTDFNLQIFDNNTGKPLTFHFGGLASVQDTTNLWPNGVVSFTFDDAYTSHYTQGKAYLDKYGWAGTEYPIIDVIDGANNTYLRLSQLKEMVKESGWEVGVHSYSSALHNQTGGITASTAAVQLSDFIACKRFLIANGMPDPVGYAYPQGIFNTATIDNLGTFCDSARTTKGRLESFPPSDRMKLYTYAMTNTTTAAQITARIDQAKANKEWLILTFHDITATPTEVTATTPTIFKAIVDYVATQGLAVRSVREVLRAAPN